MSRVRPWPGRSQSTPTNSSVMISLKKLPLLLVMWLGFAGPKLVGAENSTVRAEIEAAEKKWVGAFNRHEPEALVDLYLPDAQSFQPDIGILKGKEAIRKHFQEMAKQEKELTQTVQTLDVYPQGELATETGTWQVKNPDASMTDEGTYWMVWQKQGGDWKVLREIWNSSGKKVKLSSQLERIQRLVGTWYSEAQENGMTTRVSLTGKVVSGGDAIFVEATLWLDGKVADEWCDLMFFNPATRTLVDVGVSKSEGYVHSEVQALEDRIVFHESGFDKSGVPVARVSELVFEGEKKMRLSQLFAFKGGKPVPNLMKNVEIRRAE